MPFDAGFTAAVVTEIRKEALGARVERVFQPQKDAILLLLRTEGDREKRSQTLRLLIDAGTANPRICFLNEELENPKTPPMLCMLLRKHLNGARLVSVDTLGFERAVELTFEGRDEMGYIGKKYLVAEIMGKFSNLLLCDKEKRILSAVRTHDITSQSKRPILPGTTYLVPPIKEGKVSPLDESEGAFFEALAGSALPFDRFLLARYAGLSPLIARELAFRAGGDAALLWENFVKLTEAITKGDFTPLLLSTPDGTPLDYSFFPIAQYGDGAVIDTLDSFSEVLNRYYAERSRRERVRQKAADITKLLTNAEGRLRKKLAVQKSDLAACAEKELYRRRGDLITANIYRLSRGMEEAVLTDYFEEDCPEVRVPLDSRLTPAQNAQRQYKLYAKKKSAEQHLTEQIARGEDELAYLETVSDALMRAEGESELSEIRRELYQAGYASRMKREPQMKLPTPKPQEYVSTGGWRILCGKNNSQNDYITFKLAGKGDLWFHVKGYPGSHVVLLCDGAEPDAVDFTEAATVAAVHSQAPEGQRVEVDYTRIKNVKKPPASKPGYVTFSGNYSAYVYPDRTLVEGLRKKGR